MKSQITFTKKDVTVTLSCLIFLLANLGAIGTGGRRRAKEAVCISNLRQWGSVFSAYTADYDGSFHEGWGGTAQDSNWWMDAMREYYMGCPEIRFCLVAANENLRVSQGFVNFGIWDDEWLGNIGHRGSYGINGWVENKLVEIVPSMAPLRWRTDQVSGAENIPLFLDAPWIDCWPYEYDSPPALDNMSWQEGSHMARFCKNRHEGYINCLFLDYSVRKIGLKELWILKWHREYDTCGPWTVCGGVQPTDWPTWMQEFEDY